MVVFGPYVLRGVRTRYTAGRTVVIGSVRSSLWDIRLSVGPYVVVLRAHGVYGVVTPDTGTVHGCLWDVWCTVGPYVLYDGRTVVYGSVEFYFIGEYKVCRRI